MSVQYVCTICLYNMYNMSVQKFRKVNGHGGITMATQSWIWCILLYMEIWKFLAKNWKFRLKFGNLPKKRSTNRLLWKWNAKITLCSAYHYHVLFMRSIIAKITIFDWNCLNFWFFSNFCDTVELDQVN